MARITDTAGKSFDVSQFTRVSEVAQKVGVKPPAIKRWLKGRKTKAVWGKDRREWLYVKTSDIHLLVEYYKSIDTSS